MTKAADTHSEHVKLIAFPRQQWLYEGASVLRCTVRILPVLFIKQYSLHLLKLLSIITIIRSLTTCFSAIYPCLYHKSLFFASVPNFRNKF